MIIQGIIFTVPGFWILEYQLVCTYIWLHVFQAGAYCLVFPTGRTAWLVMLVSLLFIVIRHRKFCPTKKLS